MNSMFEIFQYGFILRGLEAGILIGITAPLIGIFLVLRRYSLIADTLSHVSLAGVAIGLLTGMNPLLTALGAASISSLAIEKLRSSKKIYGETALSIFLSGSLALAVVLIGLAHGFNVDLFSYLFGSIVTVKQSDVYYALFLSLFILVLLFLFYKELVYISFDEDASKVSGLPVKVLNNLFILLSAAAIALAIPIVGILLISALLVLPAVTALQFRKSFKATLIIAELISLFSIISGIVLSFYLNVASGGTIVLIMLLVFVVIFFTRKDKVYKV